ncbi:MAG: 4-alpha-glucanotransferase [Acidimicrobiales bacterium]
MAISPGPTPDPTAWGVEPGYHDYRGRWQDHAPAAVRSALVAMGAEGEPPPSPLTVVKAGSQAALAGPSVLVEEDGTERHLQDRLPPDLDLGYHQLYDVETGRTEQLIVTPPRCPKPPRCWGWAVQLYALRSGRSWGLGDLGDLARLGTWSHSLGAELALINPLGAARAGLPQESSPYSPGTRVFRSLLYLELEPILARAGLGTGCGDEVAAIIRAARATNADSQLDRDRIYRLKIRALELAWTAWGQRDRSWEAWRATQGGDLESFAIWTALAEEFGQDWRAWPSGVAGHEGQAIVAFAQRHRDRISFHCWVQWLLDAQLAAAGASIELMVDLPVGFHPGGFDAWCWQDCVAGGITLGAPPDDFSPQGQNWGLAAFDPWRLRSANYGPFITTLRANLAHARAIRIDHVMGLFRQYWVPAGQGDRPTTEETPGADTPSGRGAYVRFPHRDLLSILALECHRAGCFVVGEDLGTVSDEIRNELAARRVLGTRLAWFEDQDPRSWPEMSQAALTTHDLPTAAGVWRRSDPMFSTDGPSAEGLRTKLKSWSSGEPNGHDEGPTDVVESAHLRLARASSAVATVTLEDAVATTHRPNVPGSTNPHNWSHALSASLEEIMQLPLPKALAQAMNQSGRAAADADSIGPTTADPANHQ